MKHMKKIASFVLAAIMVLAMVVPTFADPTTYAITINTNNDAVTHTYKIYQIFTGTPGSGVQLTDLKYGKSYGTEGTTVPESVLSAIGSGDAGARAFAASIVNNLGSEVAILNGTTTSYNAVPGYYLVLDTAYTPTDATKDAYSAFMLKVVNAATEFTPKKSFPSVDKQVQDEAADKDTDSTDTSGWGNTADHAIGETFKFKLTATIPAEAALAYYDSYMVQFNDTLSTGVVFESIASVEVNDATVNAGTGDSDYTLSSNAVSGLTNGTWTLTINDIKGIDGVNLGTNAVTITVVYNAHLDKNAYVNHANGNTTNKNEVTLTYSNNPDATGTGSTDTTPPKAVWVFTYEVDNTKKDASGKAVPNAGFTLKQGGSAVSLYKIGDNYYVYDANKASEYTGGEVVTEITTTSSGVFNIKGLDTGSYTLVETTVPNGYVQAEDVSITVAADHSVASGTPNVTLISSTGLTNNIVNYTGATLPTTGGIGTTIFYVLGSILVLGAVILLAARRRMSR